MTTTKTAKSPRPKARTGTGAGAGRRNTARKSAPRAKAAKPRTGRKPSIKIERRTPEGGRVLVSVQQLSADTGINANYLRLLLRHGRGVMRKGATQRAVSDQAARTLAQYLGWSDKKVRATFGGRVDAEVIIPA